MKKLWWKWKNRMKNLKSQKGNSKIPFIIFALWFFLFLNSLTTTTIIITSHVITGIITKDKNKGIKGGTNEIQNAKIQNGIPQIDVMIIVIINWYQPKRKGFNWTSCSCSVVILRIKIHVIIMWMWDAELDLIKQPTWSLLVVLEFQLKKLFFFSKIIIITYSYLYYNCYVHFNFIMFHSVSSCSLFIQN